MFSDILAKNPIVPVVTINSEQQAIALTRALVAGGISVVEITLRTPVALDAIKAVKENVPDCTVLAGTVVTAENMASVHAAGVDGAISPAFSTTLLKAAKELRLPFLPGVATPSEVLAGMEQGISEFKLFPASAVGGIPLLKSLYGPMPMANFCPTGGLTMENFTSYLALPNVICIGGSWMVPRNLISLGDWSAITAIAKKTINKANLTLSN